MNSGENIDTNQNIKIARMRFHPIAPLKVMQQIIHVLKCQGMEWNSPFLKDSYSFIKKIINK